MGVYLKHYILFLSFVANVMIFIDVGMHLTSLIAQTLTVTRNQSWCESSCNVIIIVTLYVTLYCTTTTSVESLTDKQRMIKSINITNFRSCFNEIGCVEVNESWYDRNLRPMNVEPLDRNTIKTEFLLIKCHRNKSDLYYNIISTKKEVIDISGFERNEPVVFLVHDFTSNGYTGWIKHLTNAIPKTLQANLISVDWESGAEPPFEQAAANARVVALEIVALIRVLQEFYRVCPTNMHIIGHGVGAHIAGYVGKSVKDLNRITALDPTGPYFTGMPSVVRLDVNDASYVEVLHTDAFNRHSQGTRCPMGHADFYINNAQLQPKCNISTNYPPITQLDRDSLKEGSILPACSHKRAFKYYIESIENPGCKFLGIRCDSYEHFVDGKCVSCTPLGNKTSCATFGIHSQSTKGKENMFYLNTHSDSPYCMHTYRVTVFVKRDSKTQFGKFEFMFVDDDDVVTNASMSDYGHKKHKFQASQNYSFIYYASPPKVLRVKEAKVKWIAVSPPFCILFCDKAIRVEKISVIYLQVDGKSCPENVLYPEVSFGEIQSGSYVNFKRTVPTKIPP